MDFGGMELAFLSCYGDGGFVRVLPKGLLPEINAVRGTNSCCLAFIPIEGSPEVLGFSCIDNLTKGASGQAVQNFNLMVGLEESAGLPVTPLYP
jgi:N-acetyl-gamma-glutamyl-phosphate reductase